jgi:quercetin dioxygenase-like cupin family protein
MNPSQILSTPQILADLVSVQPGSVVSRMLLKNACGSLTLFAFDAGQGLSEHSTPHEATVLVLEGSVEITIGGKGHRVGPQQMLHLPGGVPHALDAHESLKMLLVMLKSAAPEQDSS